uniref:AlNc14C738G12470 protein n=1 Tax=Albugo laibachii Nc14 TaxID=890382 RepID=F0X1Z1_9STRA|nr:AlNc14C738G12470 [Albugo laibachii Nc14]|eukprot:CCA27850.1 AlNc14C738G12470 [Albugo laibachii Nc14]
MWRDILHMPASSHLQIFGNKKGWWTSDFLLAFPKHHFGGRSANDPPVILLWDDMSVHWTKDVMSTLPDNEYRLFEFHHDSPSAASWSTWRGTRLKDRLRAKWISEIRVRIKNNDKAVAPRRYDVMEWLVEAWSALSSHTIVDGFRKCRLSPRSMDNSSAADNAYGIADIFVDGGLLEDLVARRVVEPGQVSDEDDIEWTSGSEEIQESHRTPCIGAYTNEVSINAMMLSRGCHWTIKLAHVHVPSSRKAKKGRAGRKGHDKAALLASIQTLPPPKRTKIRTLATAVGVTVVGVQRLLKTNAIVRHTNTIMPSLTDANKTGRVRFAVLHVNPETPVFATTHDVVHIDEK